MIGHLGALDFVSPRRGCPIAANVALVLLIVKVGREITAIRAFSVFFSRPYSSNNNGLAIPQDGLNVKIAQSAQSTEKRVGSGLLSLVAIIAVVSLPPRMAAT